MKGSWLRYTVYGTYGPRAESHQRKKIFLKKNWVCADVLVDLSAGKGRKGTEMLSSAVRAVTISRASQYVDVTY
jgi:hypothetical protein